MRLHVRRGSRRHGCPLLKDEDNQIWAMIFAAEGLPTAEARAQALAAAANFVAEHGERLHALLCEVALLERLPEWVTLSAAGLGIELGSVLGRAVEVESSGDRRSLERR